MFTQYLSQHSSLSVVLCKCCRKSTEASLAGKYKAELDFLRTRQNNKQIKWSSGTADNNLYLLFYILFISRFGLLTCTAVWEKVLIQHWENRKPYVLWKCWRDFQNVDKISCGNQFEIKLLLYHPYKLCNLWSTILNASAKTGAQQPQFWARASHTEHYVTVVLCR